jgi:hypothetical protein
LAHVRQAKKIEVIEDVVPVVKDTPLFVARRERPLRLVSSIERLGKSAE